MENRVHNKRVLDCKNLTGKPADVQTLLDFHFKEGYIILPRSGSFNGKGDKKTASVTCVLLEDWEKRVFARRIALLGKA